MNILFTGATGQLGAELLHVLLKNSKKETKIYLLTRSLNNQKAKARIKEQFIKSVGKQYLEFYLNKISVLEGDITQENLGLTNETYADILEKINIVYHCAALANFKASLSQVRMFKQKGG